MGIVAVVIVAIAAGAIVSLNRGSDTPCPFSLQVIPDHIEPSIVGQRCVFLVTVADEGRGSGEGEAVNISATVDNASVTVNPQTITPGLITPEVVEVTVIPNEINWETPFPFQPKMILTVNITGERGGLENTETSTLVVVEGEADVELAATAAEMRDKFIPWLGNWWPEFGITSETEWDRTIVKPGILVVMHYLYFSEEWEMGVQWHVTIPPHDWVRIYLRHRFTEVAPSYAFEISTEGGEPHAIDLENIAESVWR